ncbi:hypothetical protein ACJMK2_020704 [Sinanodonta woodiana]|uniref:Secreted protein n=1 Tax=Sinanodonta woodiana TaxID=1069815 RepID=A0ABD3U1M1_SINWO
MRKQISYKYSITKENKSKSMKMPMKTVPFILLVALYDVCSSAVHPDLGINQDCMMPPKHVYCRPGVPRVFVYTFHLLTRTCKKISGCYPDSAIRQDNNLFRSEVGCHHWCNNIFE